MKLKRDENSLQNTNSETAVKTKTPNATVAIAIATAPKVRRARPAGHSHASSASGSSQKRCGRQVVGQTDQQPPGEAPGHELGRLAVEDRETDACNQAHGEIGSDDDAGDGIASGKELTERARQRRSPRREDCRHCDERADPNSGTADGGLSLAEGGAECTLAPAQRACSRQERTLHSGLPN